MNDIDIKELEKKILEGIALAYQKLVEQKNGKTANLCFHKMEKLLL